MADNYAIQIERARGLFLDYKQDAMVRRLGLEQDAEHIWIQFLHSRWRIDRRDGRITEERTGQEAGHNVYLSIFDYLCRTGPAPVFSGRKKPLNSLGRIAHSGVDESFLFDRYARLFDRAPEPFCAACCKIGAVSFPIGDAAFEFTIFPGLTAALQLWRSDEEFAPRLTLLWDENSLDALRYETLWFIAHELLHRISQQMDGQS